MFESFTGWKDGYKIITDRMTKLPYILPFDVGNGININLKSNKPISLYSTRSAEINGKKAFDEKIDFLKSIRKSIYVIGTNSEFRKINTLKISGDITLTPGCIAEMEIDTLDLSELNPKCLNNVNFLEEVSINKLILPKNLEHLDENFKFARVKELIMNDELKTASKNILSICNSVYIGAHFEDFIIDNFIPHRLRNQAITVSPQNKFFTYNADEMLIKNQNGNSKLIKSNGLFRSASFPLKCDIDSYALCYDMFPREIKLSNFGYIAENAFYNCTLFNVHIDDDKEISANAFYDCNVMNIKINTFLDKHNIHNGNQIFNSCKCDKISTDLPKIDSLFYKCVFDVGYKPTIIPSSVETLGENAFVNCNFGSCVIDFNNVTKIEGNLFNTNRGSTCKFNKTIHGSSLFNIENFIGYEFKDGFSGPIFLPTEWGYPQIIKTEISEEKLKKLNHGIIDSKLMQAIEFKPLPTLDELIEQGKSISEINNIMLKYDNISQESPDEPTI